MASVATECIWGKGDIYNGDDSMLTPLLAKQITDDRVSSVFSQCETENTKVASEASTVKMKEKAISNFSKVLKILDQAFIVSSIAVLMLILLGPFPMVILAFQGIIPAYAPFIYILAAGPLGALLLEVPKRGCYRHPHLLIGWAS